MALSDISVHEIGFTYGELATFTLPKLYFVLNCVTYSRKQEILKVIRKINHR